MCNARVEAKQLAMKITPVLLITHDDLLWQHWRDIDPAHWLPARGRNLSDLQRWQEQGRILAVLDTGLPGLPAWNAPSWPAALNGVRLLAASPSPNEDEGSKVLGAGAFGYCHSYAPHQSLAQVLEVLARGGIWMGPSLVTRLLRILDERSPSDTKWQSSALSEREHTVALRAANGASNEQIGEALGITERTVRAHMSAVFSKLGVADRLQLALLVHGISR